MTARSAYYSMVIVDIEQFGRRKDPDQQWLRRQMYDVLARAATQAGIPWSECHRTDRGDGVIILVPASVAKEDITEGFVRELNTELGIYARRSSESVAMRMRVALHAGDVVRDEQGWVNTELNTACRLVDLPALRDALAEAPNARLALVVSDAWFTAVVRHNTGAVDHRDYLRVPISVKELDGWAWIHVPGQPKQEGSPAPNRATPGEPATPNATAAEAPARDATAQGGTTTLNFSGKVRANTIVGRDQTNYHAGAFTPRQDRQ